MLWKKIIGEYGIVIDFAYRSFVWTNEAKGKAAVHCVIIGFSKGTLKKKKIFDGDEVILTQNINPYLVDAPTVFIESRKNPLVNVAKINYGSMPIDNGFLILSNDEKKQCVDENPDTEILLKRYVGGDELINNKIRWCLWLKDTPDPRLIRKSRFIMDRIRNTKQFRETSKRIATNKLADYPMLFGEIRQPDSQYIAIPKVSSERRRYIPISIVEPNVIANGSLLIISEANLYNFGILTSNVHMAWMRTTCGRMKSDYQYSASAANRNMKRPQCFLEEEHCSLLFLCFRGENK
ncbi:type IIL restriction-modification enzyme MmeI [Peribacillus simplex]|uniref:type IIL restriction-modification enzyme MmeI n=1 Tax=Peribacillus simplex TaxID=1478 RepID=UPI0032EA1A1C